MVIYLTPARAECQAPETQLVLAEQSGSNILSSGKLSQISPSHPLPSKVTAPSSVFPEPFVQIFTKDKDPASTQEYRSDPE